MTKHNRRYKDSVFVDLFGEDKDAKKNFLSLYNALHCTHLDGSAELTPLRLEHIMYMSFCNDVSCLIDNKIIVLAEHQSTVNSNMPSQTPYVHVPCLRRCFCAAKTSHSMCLIAILGDIESKASSNPARALFT